MLWDCEKEVLERLCIFLGGMFFWVLSSLALLPVLLCCLLLCCFSNSLDVERGGARADVLSQAMFQHSFFLCVCVCVCVFVRDYFATLSQQFLIRTGCHWGVFLCVQEWHCSLWRIYNSSHNNKNICALCSACILFQPLNVLSLPIACYIETVWDVRINVSIAMNVYLSVFLPNSISMCI